MVDESGSPVTTGKVVITVDDKSVDAFLDDHGFFAVNLPAGHYDLAYTDMGRETLTREIQVVNDQTLDGSATMSRAARVVFTVTDESGADTPCKVQFHGLASTPNPKLGPESRARGSVDQYHSETGSFSVALPPGDYELRITRGIEFSHVTHIVKPNGDTLGFRLPVKVSVEEARRLLGLE